MPWRKRNCCGIYNAGWTVPSRYYVRNSAGLRTGRASASLLEPVRVAAYGNSRAAQSGRQHQHTGAAPYHGPGMGPRRRQGGRQGDPRIGAGLNPQTEGQTIRVPIPELNQERRRELTRKAAEYAEQARVAVRKVRQHGIEALRKLEKDSEISQDEQRKLQNDIQHLTDNHIKRIDETLNQKDKEILQI